MCFLCSYISSSPVGTYPDTLGTDKRVMKAVTVSLMKWGVNPPLIAGIFLVHILSPWQFPVRVPFQHQHQPPAVPVLAKRWLHHLVVPKSAKVDWPQVWCMSVLSYWTFGTFFSMHCSIFFCFTDSCVAGGKIVRMMHVPMGGWAENSQATPRHHEPVPEESSEDEMPPHVHKVNVFYWSL